MPIHQPVYAIEKAPRAFNALLAPLQIFFRWRGKKCIEPSRIRSVLLGHFFRADHVAPRLRHRHAALLHHPLCKEPRSRLVVLYQSQVAHHLAPKSRIQQVQNRVRDSADVLVDRKPVGDLRRIVRRAVVVRIGVAVEIPRRIHKRVHRVRFAPRRPAALRASRIHELRRRRQRRFAHARQLRIRRQQHRQILVRHGLHTIFRTVDDRNRRAPIPLPRNPPVLQSENGLGAPEALLFRERRHLRNRRRALHPAVRPGIYANSELGERFFHGLLA